MFSVRVKLCGNGIGVWWFCRESAAQQDERPVGANFHLLSHSIMRQDTLPVVRIGMIYVRCLGEELTGSDDWGSAAGPLSPAIASPNFSQPAPDPSLACTYHVYEA